ncbi:MAG TPA: LemA family protein [Deltaproteobacteria bacterium]|nr:LemA family protein [Deltaproteobacteria bacterium]
MFPSNFIAGWFDFRTAQYFDLEDKTERTAPKVSFA